MFIYAKGVEIIFKILSTCQGYRNLVQRAGGGGGGEFVQFSPEAKSSSTD